MKLFCVLFACAFALTNVACGGNSDSGSGGDGDGDGDVETGCIRMCEKANSCPDMEEQDCDGQCALITAVAEFAGCDTEWEDLVDCANENEDLACDDDTDACDTEFEAFDSCTGELEDES